MSRATFIRRTICVLLMGTMVGLAGSTALSGSGTPPPAESPIREGEVVSSGVFGSGVWGTLLCVGCGASLVAAATAPLGLMMLGTGGAQFAAACGLQCLIAWGWE